MNIDETDSISNNKRYRSFYKDIQKCLTALEKTPTSDWSSLNGGLQQLQKVVIGCKDIHDIPDKLHLFAAIARCMDPSVAMGVHKKAVETLSVVCGKVTPTTLCEYLPLFTMHLFSLLQSTANQIKPDILALIEKHIATLPLWGLQMALPGFLGALLNSYMEKDLFIKTKKILDTVRGRFDALDGLTDLQHMGDLPTNTQPSRPNLSQSAEKTNHYHDFYSNSGTPPDGPDVLSTGAGANLLLPPAPPMHKAPGRFGVPVDGSVVAKKFAFRSAFHVSMWTIIRNVPSLRSAGLQYFRTYLPKAELASGEEEEEEEVDERVKLQQALADKNASTGSQYVELTFPPEPSKMDEVYWGKNDMHVHAILAALRSSTQEVQRQALDMLLYHLPLRETGPLSNESKVLLVRAALEVLVTNQNTTLRRVFMWFYGGETINEKYFKEVSQSYVVAALIEMFSEVADHVHNQAHARRKWGALQLAGFGGVASSPTGSPATAMATCDPTALSRHLTSAEVALLAVGDITDKCLVFEIFVSLLNRPNDKESFLLGIIPHVVPHVCKVLSLRSDVVTEYFAQKVHQPLGFASPASPLTPSASLSGVAAAPSLVALPPPTYAVSPQVLKGLQLLQEKVTWAPFLEHIEKCLLGLFVLTDSECNTTITTDSLHLINDPVAIYTALEGTKSILDASRAVYLASAGAAGSGSGREHEWPEDEDEDDGSSGDSSKHNSSTNNAHVHQADKNRTAASHCLSLVTRICELLCRTMKCLLLPCKEATAVGTINGNVLVVEGCFGTTFGVVPSVAIASLPLLALETFKVAFFGTFSGLVSHANWARDSKGHMSNKYAKAVRAEEERQRSDRLYRTFTDAYDAAVRVYLDALPVTNYTKRISPLAPSGSTPPPTVAVANVYSSSLFDSFITDADDCFLQKTLHREDKSEAASPPSQPPLGSVLNPLYIRLYSEMSDTMYCVYKHDHQTRKQGTNIGLGSISTTTASPSSPAGPPAATHDSLFSDSPVWFGLTMLLVKKGEASIAVCAAQLLTDLVMSADDSSPLSTGLIVAKSPAAEKEPSGESKSIDVNDEDGEPNCNDALSVLKVILLRLWPLFTATQSSCHTQVAKLFVRCYSIPAARSMVDAVMTNNNDPSNTRYFMTLLRVVAALETQRGGSSGGSGGGDVFSEASTGSAGGTRQQLLLFYPALRSLVRMVRAVNEGKGELFGSVAAAPSTQGATPTVGYGDATTSTTPSPATPFTPHSHHHPAGIVGPYLRLSLANFFEQSGPYIRRIIDPLLFSLLQIDMSPSPAAIAQSVEQSAHQRWQANFRVKAEDFIDTLQSILELCGSETISGPTSVIASLLTLPAASWTAKVADLIEVKDNCGAKNRESAAAVTANVSVGSDEDEEGAVKETAAAKVLIHQVPMNTELATRASSNVISNAGDDDFPRTTLFGVIAYILLRIVRSAQLPASSSAPQPLGDTVAADIGMLCASRVPVMKQGYEDPLAIKALALLNCLLTNATTVASASQAQITLGQHLQNASTVSNSTVPVATTALGNNTLPSFLLPSTTIASLASAATTADGDGWVDAAPASSYHSTSSSQLAQYLATNAAVVHLTALLTNHVARFSMDFQVSSAIVYRLPCLQSSLISTFQTAVGFLDSLPECGKVLSSAIHNEYGLWGIGPSNRRSVASGGEDPLNSPSMGAAAPSAGAAVAPIEIGPILESSYFHRMLKNGLVSAAAADLHPILGVYGLFGKWRAISLSLLPLLHAGLPSATQHLLATFSLIIESVQKRPVPTPLSTQLTCRCLDSTVDLISFLFTGQGVGDSLRQQATATSTQVQQLQLQLLQQQQQQQQQAFGNSLNTGSSFAPTSRVATVGALLIIPNKGDAKNGPLQPLTSRGGPQSVNDSAFFTAAHSEVRWALSASVLPTAMRTLVTGCEKLDALHEAAHRGAQQAIRATRASMFARHQQLFAVLLRHLGSEFFEQLVWYWQRSNGPQFIAQFGALAAGGLNPLAASDLAMDAPYSSNTNYGGGIAVGPASLGSYLSAAYGATATAGAGVPSSSGGPSMAGGSSASNTASAVPTSLGGSHTRLEAERWMGGRSNTVLIEMLATLLTPNNVVELCQTTLQQLRAGTSKSSTKAGPHEMPYDAAVMHLLVNFLIRARNPERWTAAIGLQSAVIDCIASHIAALSASQSSASAAGALMMGIPLTGSSAPAGSGPLTGPCSVAFLPMAGLALEVLHHRHFSAAVASGANTVSAAQNSDLNSSATGGGPIDILKDKRTSNIFIKIIETLSPYISNDTSIIGASALVKAATESGGTTSANTSPGSMPATAASALATLGLASGLGDGAQPLLALLFCGVHLADMVIGSIRGTSTESKDAANAFEGKNIDTLCNLAIRHWVPSVRQANEIKEADVAVVAAVRSEIALSLITKLMEFGEIVQKRVRSDLLDIFFSERFFSGASHGVINKWRVLLSVLTKDRLLNIQVLQRMAGTAISKTAGVFTSIVTSADAEALTRAKLLRRLAFYTFCNSSVDTLFIMNVKDKLIETFRNFQKAGKQAAIRSALMVFRVLMTRIQPQHVASFWPVVLPEMVRVLCNYSQHNAGHVYGNQTANTEINLGKIGQNRSPSSISPAQTLQHASSSHVAADTEVTMEVLKIIDYSITLLPNDFQVFRWAFLDDDRFVEEKLVREEMKRKAFIHATVFEVKNGGLVANGTASSGGGLGGLFGGGGGGSNTAAGDAASGAASQAIYRQFLSGQSVDGHRFIPLVRSLYTSMQLPEVMPMPELRMEAPPPFLIRETIARGDTTSSAHSTGAVSSYNYNLYPHAHGSGLGFAASAFTPIEIATHHACYTALKNPFRGCLRRPLLLIPERCYETISGVEMAAAGLNILGNGTCVEEASTDLEFYNNLTQAAATSLAATQFSSGGTGTVAGPRASTSGTHFVVSHDVLTQLLAHDQAAVPSGSYTSIAFTNSDGDAVDACYTQWSLEEEFVNAKIAAYERSAAITKNQVVRMQKALIAQRLPQKLQPQQPAAGTTPSAIPLSASVGSIPLSQGSIGRQQESVTSIHINPEVTTVAPIVTLPTGATDPEMSKPAPADQDCEDDEFPEMRRVEAAGATEDQTGHRNMFDSDDEDDDEPQPTPHDDKEEAQEETEQTVVADAVVADATDEQ